MDKYDILEYSWVKATTVSMRLQISLFELTNTNTGGGEEGPRLALHRWIRGAQALTSSVLEEGRRVGADLPNGGEENDGRRWCGGC